LHNLEQGGQGAAKGQKMDSLADDLPLFSALQAKVDQGSVNENSVTVKIEQILSDVFPDELSPRQAMDILYKLKKLQQHG